MSDRKTKRFCCKYYHDGGWWGQDIYAYDEKDAAARVAKLGNLQLLGEHMMTIPAGVGSSRLANLICAVGSYFSRKKP